VGNGRTGTPCSCAAPCGGDPPENTAETLTKGTRVIVTGRLKQRTYDTRDGQKRTVTEIDVEDIGPSLRYATATVTRTPKTTTNAGGDTSNGGGDDQPPF
jgi:single-strand DNA-binding protein